MIPHGLPNGGNLRGVALRSVPFSSEPRLRFDSCETELDSQKQGWPRLPPMTLFGFEDRISSRSNRIRTMSRTARPFEANSADPRGLTVKARLKHAGWVPGSDIDRREQFRVPGIPSHRATGTAYDPQLSSPSTRSFALTTTPSTTSSALSMTSSMAPANFRAPVPRMIMDQPVIRM